MRFASPVLQADGVARLQAVTEDRSHLVEKIGREHSPFADGWRVHD
jgi:hypothetical protein